MADFILQFNRNGSSFSSKSEALVKLKEVLSTAKPAEPKVAIYTDGENERVLFGIAALTSGKYQIFEGAKLDSSGNISVPEEVQNAIDKAISGVQGDTDSTIKEVEDAIAAMDFTGATGGSIITQVTQEDGKVSATAANLTSEDKTVNVSGLDLAVNIDGTTIVKDSSTGKISVASKALTMEGEDAIEVEDGESGKTVKLNIASGDKVLSQSEAGLLASLELKYTKKTDTANGKIELIGKDNTVISTFDTADFTVDGFLDSVAWKGDGSNILVFTWNTNAGKTATEIDLTKYIDTYTNGDGLNLNNKTFSVKVKNGDKYLTVDENGVASKGIDDAIDAAIEEALGGEDAKPVDEQIEDALAELELETVGGTGKVVTTISQSNGLVFATAIDLTATNVSATAVGEGSATNVQGILTELHEEIEGVKSAAISVKAGNGIDVSGASTEKTIAVKLKSGDDNALEVSADGLFLSTTLDCGTY